MMPVYVYVYTHQNLYPCWNFVQVTTKYVMKNWNWDNLRKKQHLSGTLVENKLLQDCLLLSYS